MNKVFEKWGKPTEYLKRRLMRNQRGACFDCGVQEFDAEENFQIHRLEKHGDYNLENCILLCHPCHNKRHHSKDIS